MDWRKLVLCLWVVIFVTPACSKQSQQVIELKRFSIDTLEGILTKSGVELDKDISSDGNGSLRIDTTGPTVIRLFELGDIDVENARLIYQSKDADRRRGGAGISGNVVPFCWQR